MPSRPNNPSELNTRVWETYLKHDPDRNFLLKGIKQGFSIVDSGYKPQQAEQNNYSSATAAKTNKLVEQQILTEISEGRYQLVPNKPTIVYALGAISKPNSSEIRLIHDCSKPIGKSVNDYATKNYVKYQTFDDAISMVKPNYYMAKVDLKSTYRSVKLDPSNHDVNGLKWTFTGHTNPTYMVDTRLPFGSRLAPSIFHRLTQSVRRILNSMRVTNIVVYLDDFFICESTFERCRRALNQTITVLRKLGFHISWPKVEGPSQIIKFLGIEIDTTINMLRLPNDKLQELNNLINIFS